MITKICNSCKMSKELSCFVKNTGLNSYKNKCNECIRKDSLLQNRVDYLKEYHRNRVETDSTYVLTKRANSARYSKAHPEKMRQQAKRYNRKLKADVIQAYGGKCICCGTRVFEFLSVDHTKNDGSVHRKTIPGPRLYSWLRRNNYPRENFQLLCMNCNTAKGFYKLTIEEIKSKIFQSDCTKDLYPDEGGRSGHK